MNDVRLIQALWQLDRLSPDEGPEHATSLLVAGVDLPSLRQLAGLSAPTFWDVEPLIKRVIKEAKLPLLTEHAARWLIVYDLAERIINGEIDPLNGTGAIAAEWQELNHPEVLSGFAYYWSDYGENPKDIPWFDERIRKEAADLLSLQAPPV